MTYVYLDHAATTAIRPEVREAMLPYLDGGYGNPSSVHRFGRQARNALEQARERVAGALGAQRRELVFTGSGTEADNMAVLGRWRMHSSASAAPAAAVVTTAIEHKAVALSAKQARSEGAELIVLGVDESGRIAVDAAAEAIAAMPCVVSVMWGNNEVGTLQPVAEVGALCRERDVVFHTDAVQAFGKVRVRVDETPCDLLSVSAHKLGGPKGIGALYIRQGVQLLPLTHGGGQERDLRPGTENVASAVGFAMAAELATAEQTQEEARLLGLREQLAQRIRARVSGVRITGEAVATLPHVLHCLIADTDGEALLVALDLEGVAASGGSACASGTVKASHVLAAMGRVRPGEASLRLSLGHTTTAEELDFAVNALATVVARIRSEAA